MSLSFNTFELTFAILYCIYCWCILTPLLFYYTHRFYSFRSSPIIFKRHYRIVIAINFLISIYIICSKPALIIASLNGSSRSDNCFKTPQNCSVPLTISEIADSISSRGWSTLLLIRVWLIYFDTTYNQQYSRGQWTHFIDPTSTIATLLTESWIFSAKNTLGKECWLLKAIFAPYYLFSIYSSVMLFIFFPEHKLDAILTAPTLILFIILWCKIPKHNDVLKVRHEMVLLLRIVAVDVMLFIIYSITLAHLEVEHMRIYIIYLFQLWFATAHMLYGLCITKWVMSYSGLSVRPANQLVSYLNSNGNAVKHKESLVDILSNQETLQLFMIHLCNEWSMESLLCVIECYQFKTFVKLKNNDDSATKIYPFIFSLPLDALPRSVIVYDSELSLKEKMKHIVDKYVAVNSVFQVNIGYEVRENLERLCGDDAIGINYYECFDELLTELFHLMQDSYFRFTKNGAYASSITLYPAVSLTPESTH